MAQKTKKNNTGSIFDLFKVMQLTRAQVQYGYAIGGLKKNQLSTLAEHHYLVTFIGWQLADMAKQAGASIDPFKVVKICMVHDLGELFGGDIGMPYARRFPKAKAAARKFEEYNAVFLSTLFGGRKTKFMELWNEATEPKTDEGQIAKLADLLEIFTFRHYNDVLYKADDVLAKERMPKAVSKIKDPIARKTMDAMVKDYLKNFRKGDALSIISGMEK